MPDTTPTQAAAAIVVYFGQLDNDRAYYRNWLAGTPTGGPNGDGTYPLPDFTGAVHMVACPAKAVADLSAGGGFNLPGVLAVPAGTQEEISAGSPQVVGVTADGNLRRFTTNMFASRRTADLNDYMAAQVSDLLNVTRGGVEGRISLGAVAKIANNLTINLASPPYNVRPDYLEVRDGVTTAGSNLVNSASGLFTAGDVGKMILLSNGLTTGGGPLASTILQVISPTQVRIADTPNRSFNTNRIGWGTDNTAGVRLAAQDSASLGPYSPGATVVVPQGGILTRPFRIRARTTWFGYGARQSFFVKAPALAAGTGLDAKGIPFIRNYIIANNSTVDGKFYQYADDFINLLQIGVHGGRYFQPGGDAVTALELYSTLGDENLAQVDPYWRISFVDIFDGSLDGFHTRGRSSSNIMSLNILNCNGRGWHAESFDDNVNTLVIQANGQTGLYLNVNGGANSNFTTIKLSYNGAATVGNRLGTNLTIDSSGHLLTGLRIQESNQSNVLIRGARNEINGGSIEDTGCISRHHGGAVTPDPLSAGILFANGQLTGTQRLFCYGNRVQGVQIGPAVHRQDADGQWASHGVYFTGGPTYGGPLYNQVEIATAQPFGVINQDGTVTPWAWQNYGSGAGATGKDGSSSYNANTVRVNGVAVVD